MTTQQMTIDGTFEHRGEHTREVEAILEKYPAAITDPGLCAFLILKERYPWIAQIDEQRQHNLREFARDWPSLNRRRQEYREQHPVEKPSKVETVEF